MLYSVGNHPSPDYSSLAACFSASTPAQRSAAGSAVVEKVQKRKIEELDGDCTSDSSQSGGEEQHVTKSVRTSKSPWEALLNATASAERIAPVQAPVINTTSSNASPNLRDQNPASHDAVISGKCNAKDAARIHETARSAPSHNSQFVAQQTSFVTTNPSKDDYDRGYEDALRQAAVAAARAMLVKISQAQFGVQSESGVPRTTVHSAANVSDFRTAHAIVPQIVQAFHQQNQQNTQPLFQRAASPPHRATSTAATHPIAPTASKAQPRPRSTQSTSGSQSPAPQAATSKINLMSRLIRKDDAWEQWVLELGAKDRNDLIRMYNLSTIEREDLKKNSRRMKQNSAQKRYLKRQDEDISPRASVSPSPSFRFV